MLGKYLGKYNDLLLGAILIPVINTINYHLTYGHIRWDWYTAATYAIDTVSGYISWWIIRKIVIWLDRAWPYENGFVRRIAAQIGFTTFAVLAFTIGATEGVNALYTDEPLPAKFYTYNLFIFFIWVLVINGIYTGLYFYNQWKETLQLRERDNAIRNRGFQVSRGNKVVSLPFEQVGALYVENGQSYLKTTTGELFVLDRSLNALESLLPTEHFFRVNRRYILNRNLISGYHKKPYGKLELELLASFELPENPGISRLTAPAFKSWLAVSVQQA